MQVKALLHFPPVVCIGLLCLCGKTSIQEVRYGPDSLTIKEIRALMPLDASPSDSAKVRQALFRYSLAKKIAGQPASTDSASIKLARRLSLLSGKEWSPEAASVLLNAATALEKRTMNASDMAAVIAFVDSGFSAIDPKVVSGKNAGLPGKFTGLDTLTLRDAAFFRKTVGAVFDISSEEAATVLNFVGGDRRTKKDSCGTARNIDGMVRGILEKRSSAAAVVTHPNREIVELEREKSRNALLALRYRSQESIRDSIARRLPDLGLLYKKQLKLNEQSGGKVWVVFCVDAAGAVLSARIKSSEIANKQFQQLLEEYVRTIQFKAIPKDMDPMVFEFPFEFKAEE
jgi:TonB family protein